MQVGRLRTMGLAKEPSVGTLTVPPTDFLRFIPPDSFYPKIAPLDSKAIGSLPDDLIKVTQGPADLNGMKLKLEVEPENVGEVFEACFGLDATTEVASFIIGSSTHSIDFKEDGGTERHATIASSTYIMGSSSATPSSLCLAVKTALEAASGATGTYTVTYSTSTKKMTIAVGGAIAAVQILWLTGANQATGAYSILGWTHVDTASAASVTSASTTTVPVFTHTFVRQAVAQLPTYSFWFDKNPLYPQFAGCMLNKLDIDIKAKEFVHADTEWVGLSYDATGITHSPTYSPIKPFRFNQAVVKIDGSSILNYDNIKVSIDNMVKADHALASTIYPAKIYSEGMRVEVSMDLFFEDATQYNKFLAGTTCSLEVILTHSDDISGAASGQKYILDITIPVVFYKTANLPIPTGILKIAFSGEGVYDTNTSKTISVALTNGVAAAYN